MLDQGYVLNHRYRIVKLLGQGGFGAVYRAWDLNLNIPVAVKENLETSQEAARQFAREANILARLRHPNLPKVTDYFILPEQGQYLVMEYIEGEDLNEKLEKNGGPLPESQVLEWSKQILGALEYLHGQDPAIIHRDIKPQNIRITSHGQAMLVDFGIAKSFEGSKKTTIGARAVTPGYSPFEQYGQGATNPVSDIYACGATIYTLLTRQTPPESISRLIDDPLALPRSYNPAVSPAVEQAVLRAMEVDPTKRWQSAGEFLRALTATAPTMVVAPARAPTAAVRTYTREPTLPPKQGTRPSLALVLFAAALVLVIGVGIIGLGVYFGPQFVRSMRGASTNTPVVTQVSAANLEPTLPPTAPPMQAELVSPKEPIKIGLLAPLSGPVPSFGVSTQEGVELAIREWNARGGVLGRRIELIVRDSQCTADPAVQAANALVDQEGVRYIVGEVCSSASIPVSEIVNQKKVVQISPTSTNTNVTVNFDGTVRPFTFRACFVDPFQGIVMARFARGKGYETAFIMVDEGNDYSRELAETFERTFTDLGGRVVGREPYSGSMTDFGLILNMVSASNARVLYIPDYYNIVNLVGAQAKRQGITAVLMGGDGWDSSDLDVQAADGGFYSNHYDPGDTRPIVVEWLRKYGAEYKTDAGEPKVPDALATLGYDSTNLLIAAIEKAGVDDPSVVAQVMSGMIWEGVTGRISFDLNHNPIKNAAIIGIMNGRKTFIESVTP